MYSRNNYISNFHSNTYHKLFHEIAEENPNIKVGKVNVDDEMKLAMKFGIQSIPTLIVIKNGKAVAQSVGYQSKGQIKALLED